MATASVDASMETNRETYCQFQPEDLRSRIYSMTGIMKPTLPPTTRNARVMTCTITCLWETALRNAHNALQTHYFYATASQSVCHHFHYENSTSRLQVADGLAQGSLSARCKKSAKIVFHIYLQQDLWYDASLLGKLIWEQSACSAWLLMQWGPGIWSKVLVEIESEIPFWTGRNQSAPRHPAARAAERCKRTVLCSILKFRVWCESSTHDLPTALPCKAHLT